MKRYRFVTTFGCKENENGEWVKFSEIEPYLIYQNHTITELREKIEALTLELRELKQRGK